MNSLISCVSSDRQSAFNALRPKTTPRQILVYVEGFDDVSFWYNILSPYENQNNIKFKIQPYSNEENDKIDNKFMDGKKGLQKLFGHTGRGKYLIICLDSDYDYLFPEHSIKAKKINESDYIFQTYTYSIENLKCYSESLSGVCVQATQNTDEKIDFPAFFKNYSETIYPLFLWNLYFYSVKQEKKFTDDKFLEVIKIIDTPKLENNGKPVLDEIEKKVKEKIQKLQQEFPNDIKKIAHSLKTLKESGLLNSNAYLFIKGHALYDNVVLMLLKPLCRELISTHKEQIKKLSEEEKKKLLDKYAEELPEDKIQKKAKKLKDDRDTNYKSTVRIETLLSANDKFKDCFLFKKIEKDIQVYLKEFKMVENHV
jgi:uncharacterized protein YjgD (DUF1641 family)